MKLPTTIETRAIADLTAYEGNPKKHPAEQIAAIERSMREFGWTVPVLIDADDRVIAGHGRLEAASRLGLKTVPTIRLAHLSEDQVRAYRLADNKLTEMGGWDDALLAEELTTLAAAEFDTLLTGFDADEIAALIGSIGTEGRDTEAVAAARGVLAEEFIEPPLSVLNTMAGRWQERKRAWVDLMPTVAGARGRDDNLYTADVARSDPQFYEKKTAQERRLGRKLSKGEFERDYWDPPENPRMSGVSNFDPVLAELIVTWFSAEGMRVCDPFAGDIERGLVAGVRGREYSGIEVRPEQCEANAGVADRMGLAPMPAWHCGTSADALSRWGRESADLIFTCPPYWNLEKYSDDPADLSNMSLGDFTAAHADIINQCAAVLRPDRFAVWVIGDTRDRGYQVDLQGRTKRAFEDAGLKLHAEMILVTAVGSKRTVARRAMNGRRTIVSRHEYVLVFCKGSAKAAAQALGPVKVGDFDTDGAADE